MENVPTQEVTRETKAMPYRQAQTVMTPAAVEGAVKVEGDVAMADVHTKDLPAAAVGRCDISHSRAASGLCACSW
jgi:hypothetical protein